MNDQLPEKTWLTLKQAAAIAQVSQMTLRREIRSGQLRHIRIGGRKIIRIRAEWLEAWLNFDSIAQRIHRLNQGRVEAKFS